MGVGGGVVGACPYILAGCVNRDAPGCPGILIVSFARFDHAIHGPDRRWKENLDLCQHNK
jgi:hypothetical protein